MNSLPNMTVSVWANFDNNGTSPSVFFSMTRANEWAGNINLMSETGWRKSGSDTLLLKGLVVTNKDNNPSWQDSRNEPKNGGVQSPKGINKWNHIIMTWDGATSNFKIYHNNGVKVSNPEWETRGTTGPLNFYTQQTLIAWQTNLPNGAYSWSLATHDRNGGQSEFTTKRLLDAEMELFMFELAGR